MPDSVVPYGLAVEKDLTLLRTVNAVHMQEQRTFTGPVRAKISPVFFPSAILTNTSDSTFSPVSYEKWTPFVSNMYDIMTSQR